MQIVLFQTISMQFKYKYSLIMKNIFYVKLFSLVRQF